MFLNIWNTFFFKFSSNQALYQITQQRKVLSFLDHVSEWPFQVTQWHRSLWLLFNGLDKIVIIRASFSTTGTFYTYCFKPRVLQQLQIHLSWFHLPYLQTRGNMDLHRRVGTMELNSAINATTCRSYIRNCKMRLWPHHWRAYLAPLR